MTELCFNGVSGVTGQYLAAPRSLDELAAALRGAPAAPALELPPAHVPAHPPSFGLPWDVDPHDLAGTGWAVVFSQGVDDAVRAALAPLLERRAAAAGDRFKVLDHRAGESCSAWLRRHGVTWGNVDPTQVPFNLLLVGGPEVIPFDFHYLLDIEYSVGRLSCDSPADYRRYAESVVAYETAPSVPTTRDVVFLGPRHAADAATELSATQLVAPLCTGRDLDGRELPDRPVTAALGYRSHLRLGPDATRAAALDALAGRGVRPSLLFTASHGVGFPAGHPDQRAAQGALLMQDWTGFGSIRPEHYLRGADVPDDARLHGLVAFFFACYGAGTPAADSFPPTTRAAGPAIAPAPFVAALPARLLSHPQGSALAVIGHVDRAWGYSIRPPGVAAQLVPFRNCLGRILAGQPVGQATKDFSERFAGLSAALATLLSPGAAATNEAALVCCWLERNDAQSYVILGDPAVRLRVAELA